MGVLDEETRAADRQHNIAYTGAQQATASEQNSIDTSHFAIDEIEFLNDLCKTPEKLAWRVCQFIAIESAQLIMRQPFLMTRFSVSFLRFANMGHHEFAQARNQGGEAPLEKFSPPLQNVLNIV